ncbi:MAG: coenzyme F420-0:L-glutamate ligase [Gammaproteobacteria bacterium]|nr:coenzyme F420-0:L-glutamate ligase [Gammaproteobacteria bacterium]
MPLIHPGDDLAGIIGDALDRAGLHPHDRDVLVIAQKVVSKAEGRLVALDSVTPSKRARRVAARVDKDPRLVELVLREAAEVVACRPGALIVRHRCGYVLANAGIDHSNVDARAGTTVLLLPCDADASAARLRAALERRYGVTVAVVINDSTGRAWRNGTVGIALGAAGLPALLDMRGWSDLFGRRLEITETGFADEIAAAASLVMGQADEGRPVVLLRGLRWHGESNAAALLRPPADDLFRLGAGAHADVEIDP